MGLGLYENGISLEQVVYRHKVHCANYKVGTLLLMATASRILVIVSSTSASVSALSKNQYFT